MKQKTDEIGEMELLERYLNGQGMAAEGSDEDIIPDKDFSELQEAFEEYCKGFSKTAPKQVKEDLHQKILFSKSNRSTNALKLRWSLAAAAVLFLVFSSILYLENRNLRAGNDKLEMELALIQKRFGNNSKELAAVKKELDRLQNPETQKYLMLGNERAKNLKTVAYINPVEKLSMLDIIDLPKLPANQEYQIWAKVDGKMVNLGVLEPVENKLMRIPFKENVSSYQITIESVDKNSVASSQVVADVELHN